MTHRQANFQTPPRGRRPIKKGWVGPVLITALLLVWVFCLWTYDRQVSDRWQEDRQQRLEIAHLILNETVEQSLRQEISKFNTLLTEWQGISGLWNEVERELRFKERAQNLGVLNPRVLERNASGRWTLLAGERSFSAEPRNRGVVETAIQDGLAVGQPRIVDSATSHMLVCAIGRDLDRNTILIEGDIPLSEGILTADLNRSTWPDLDKVVWGLRSSGGSDIVRPQPGGVLEQELVSEISVRPWLAWQMTLEPTEDWFVSEKHLQRTIWIIGGLAMLMTLALLIHIEMKNKVLLGLTHGAYEAADLVETILDSSEAHAIIATDLTGRIIRANRGTGVLVGHQPDSMVGESITILDHPQAVESDRFEQVLIETLEVGRFEDVVMAKRADGSLTHLQLTCSMRRDGEGHPIGYVLLAHDVSALLDRTLRLEQVNSELVEQTRLAKRANRLINEFLANMSHELRTPLNAILGYARLIKRKTMDLIDDRQRSNLDHITEAGENLLNLINDLLDLSKIEAGRMPLQCETVDLSHIVNSVFETVRPLADSQRNHMRLKMDKDLPTVISDAQHLRQILMNLVGNSIKFTHRGKVDVIIERGLRPTMLQIRVQDTGIGIPEDQLPHIFEAFYQADGSASRPHGGTGLGLSIVHRLVEHLGGTIRVDSRKGKGTCFTIDLPIDVTAEHPVIERTPQTPTTA